MSEAEKKLTSVFLLLPKGTVENFSRINISKTKGAPGLVHPEALFLTGV
jgi:hypothetical protein